jgi:chemotaxis protein CheD
VTSPPPAVPERGARPAVSAKTLYLQPGQLTVSGGAHILTIVGSCVAVCLFDPVAGVGGMNHYLLPRGPRGTDSPRFGEVALPRLLEQMLALGATPATLEAKVFGGARVLAGVPSSRDLGAENVALALPFLQAQGIAVTARDTGGSRGRKLIFQTSDGVVWLKTF